MLCFAAGEESPIEGATIPISMAMLGALILSVAAATMLQVRQVLSAVVKH